jgi:predicted ATP-dependent endonuclease of OLD family
MLVGVFLKNFKCYQAIQYVSIFSKMEEKFIGYLGDNGIGKSAVLEALDAFFSKKPRWFKNKDARRGDSDTFVAPIFLLKKDDLKSEKFFVKIEELSKTLAENLKDKIVPIPDQLVVGVAKKADGTFSFFDGKKELNEDWDAEDLYNYFIDHYQYVYIDSEVDIDEETKINSEVSEMIVGSPIVAQIEKKFEEIDEVNPLVAPLNQILGDLIDKRFTDNLKKIDEDYSYGSIQGATSRLTRNILARVSTVAFLDSRKLKYDGKQLASLSSGQRRKALLDFITAILEGREFENDAKSLILAIDEPEISLDAGRKMAQFERLISISKKGMSVLFTSHWYGWIASTDFGSCAVIEDDEGKNRKKITTYLNSDFPFSRAPKYEMRMIFDFLVSLGAEVESNPLKKYIICEGITDSNYLSASLEDSNFRIIPVKKQRVKKIADIFRDYYLSESVRLKNVLFLIDTDPEHKDSFSNPHLKRWCKNNNTLKITLLSGEESFYTKCVIEDVLEPELFLQALKKVFSGNAFIEGLGVKYPSLTGIDAFGLDATQRINFDSISQLNKIEVSKEYCALLSIDKSKSSNNSLKDLIQSHFS